MFGIFWFCIDVYLCFLVSYSILLFSIKVKPLCLHWWCWLWSCWPFFPFIFPFLLSVPVSSCVSQTWNSSCLSILNKNSTPKIEAALWVYVWFSKSCILDQSPACHTEVQDRVINLQKFKFSVLFCSIIIFSLLVYCCSVKNRHTN